MNTVFENLLSKLPANDTTMAHVRLVDFAGFAESYGYLPLDPSSSKELIESHIRCLTKLGNFVINRLFAGWPVELRDYQSELHLYADLGFSTYSANQFASTQGSYGVNTPYPTNYELAIGAFDPADTARRLQLCECDQPELQSHLGIEYFDWSAEPSVSNRLRRPFYDHIGRGAELLVREGEAYYSVSDGAIDDFIDVIQGELDALDESVDHVNLVRWSAGLGTLGEVSIRDRGFSIAETETLFRGRTTTEKLQQSQPLMGEFDLAAMSIGSGDEGIFGSIVLSFPSDTEAIANQEIFLSRLVNVDLIALGIRETNSWSNVINKVEVQSAGKYLIIRLVFHDPRDTMMLLRPNNLVLTR